MNNTDRESLLNPGDRGRYYPVRSPGNHGLGSRWTNKFILSSILILFATCSAIYIYLNMVMIDSNQNQPNKFKPLSRRKPMLDHESIFSGSGPSMLRVADLMAHCIVALKIAGQEVVNLSLKNNERLVNVGSKGKTLEGVDDVVTGADMRSHHFIVNTIKDSYRRLRVVSEEDSTREFENRKLEEDLLPISRHHFANLIRSELDTIENLENFDRYSMIAQDDTLIWIDPLDATKEYSENMTEFVTLMACIVHKSTPIAGIILKPFTRQIYWSLVDTKTNESHFSSDLKLAHDSKSSLDREKINLIVSRSHAGKVNEFIGRLYGPKATVVKAGGSGYKTIQVIRGQADAYVHATRIKKWDICAPYAIVKSFGEGSFTDLKGRPIDFSNPKDILIGDGLIASMSPILHEKIVSAMNAASTSE